MYLKYFLLGMTYPTPLMPIGIVFTLWWMYIDIRESVARRKLETEMNDVEQYLAHVRALSNTFNNNQQQEYSP